MGEHTTALVALLSGGAAGLCVDISLFPLDTVKTRLQSSSGLWPSGGLGGIYRGIGSVAIGSVPGAGIFFCTYEVIKRHVRWGTSDQALAATHMCAASCGEVMACLVRVPVEVIKQRSQVAAAGTTSFGVFSSTLRQEGFGGLYRGYLSTVLREVPFSLLQFPLWEYFKNRWERRQGCSIDAWQSAVCGAGSGALAGAITTPLDVAKTRIMLAQAGTGLAKGNIFLALKHIWQEHGIKGCFAGIVPRVLWISVGGAIFLGVYDKARSSLNGLQQAIV